MKISLIQFQVKLDSLKESLRRAESSIIQAKNRGAQIICFPEYFLTGSLDYYEDSPEKLEYVITKAPSIIKKKFAELSKQYNIILIAGSIAEKIKGKLIVNRSYIFRSGKIVSYYDKINLLEETHITPGSKLSKVINVKGVKIGITICRDLFHPNIYKELARQGAEIIFVPSYWSVDSYIYNGIRNAAKRYRGNNFANKATKILSLARSLENGIFILFVSACGTIKQNEKFDILLGKSAAISPLKGIFRKSPYMKKSELITVDLDLKEAKDAKNIYSLGDGPGKD